MTQFEEGNLLQGTYEILSKMNEGGMGAIYKVRHRHLDEIRVVKVLRPDLLDNEEMVQRFTQEAQLVTKLKHPNIASIYDFVVDPDGMSYIVMEFVDGSNLAQVLGLIGPPSLTVALEVARQTLGALGYLHRRKIVHRDVSAANIMLAVSEEDGKLHAKLIDMGLAKSLETNKGMTSTGVIMGNLYYASPEQLGQLAEGETLDGRSDVYSLGAVLYELVTGRRAFTGKTPMELVTAHALRPPLGFDVSDPSGRVPEELRAVILRSLAKKPSERFQTAEEFAEALLPIQQRQAEEIDVGFVKQLVQSARPKSSPTNPGLGRRRQSPGRTPLPESGPRSSTPAGLRSSGAAGLRSSTPAPMDGKTSVESAPPRRVTDRPTSSDATRLVSNLPIPMTTRGTPVRTALFVAIPVAVVAAVGTLLFSRSPGKPAAPPVATRPIGPRPTPVRAEPTPVPTAPPLATPTQGPRVEEMTAAAAARAKAEAARDYAEKARLRAEKAGARDLPAYARGARSQKDGEARLAAARVPEALRAFEQASEAFAEAETSAVDSARQKLVDRANATPVVPPTSVPPTPRPTETAAPRPTVEKPKAPTEDERVRAAVDRYAAAQSQLDVDQYIKVFPSLAAQRSRLEEAFRSYRSQSLEVDVKKVELDGDKATVRAVETRTFVPKVGSEGRDTRPVVLRLQLVAGEWVITRRE